MSGDDVNGSSGDTNGAHGDRKGKSARCAEFATWLVKTFGKDILSSGTGVIDVAGGRGELSFELAVKHDVPTTLLDPRHPGKLSKAQRKLIEERAAAAAHDDAVFSGDNGSGFGDRATRDVALVSPATRNAVLPKRVRAMLTLHGATRVGTGAGSSGGDSSTGENTLKPVSDDVVKTTVEKAAAAMSAPATANDDHRKAKKRRPDAVKSAAVGWSEVDPDVHLEDVLSHCKVQMLARTST